MVFILAGDSTIKSFGMSLYRSKAKAACCVWNMQSMNRSFLPSATFLSILY